MDAHVAQGRPRHMWIDDIKNWTKLDTYEKIKRTAAERLKWRTYTTTCQPSTTSGRIKEKPVGGTMRRGAVGAEGVGSGEGAEPPPQKIFDIFYS